ncbi:MAG: SDR family oxidoreductase [Anaerolineales bacterium]|jgi:3-dehydrosphinganine reductase
MEFFGKVALVTGGSSGIGLATADELSHRGAHVWLVARGEERLRSALAEVEGHKLREGQRFGFSKADVSDEGQVSALVETVIHSMGLPDILINSAGEVQPGYAQDLAVSAFRQMMDIDYFGTVHTIKAVLPGMIARGSGQIVNVSSLAGLIGGFGYSAYAPAKAAVYILSDVLRSEMKPHGIRITVVFPPDTDTPQLVYDRQHRPVETEYAAGAAGMVSAQAVAKAIVHGIERGQHMILPGFQGKMIFWLSGVGRTVLQQTEDSLVARAQKKMRTAAQ